MATALEDAAKGAAMGVPFGGPIGAAIGGLGGVLAHYAPSLITDLFGQPEAKAVELASAAVQVVQAVTGTTDPAEALTAAADPNVELQLRVQLAQISADARRAELDAQAAVQASVAAQVEAQLQAAIADVADARQSMAKLASGGSKLAYGPAVISALVLFAFFTVVVLILMNRLDQNTLLVGGMLTMASNVVAFWTGTTAGSASKTQQLVDMANKAADANADTVPTALAMKLLPAGAGKVLKEVEAAALPFVVRKIL